MTAPSTERRRVPWWLWVISGLVVAGLIAVPVVASMQGAGGAGAATQTPAPTLQASTPPAPSPAASASPTPAVASPSASAGAPVAPIAPEAPPVAPDETANASGGLTFALDAVEAVEGEATTPGEVGGPAVRVTISVTNDGAEDLDLAQIAVNAYIGVDRLPAGTIAEPGGEAFAGVLAAGETAQGVYLFSIPEAARGDVLIGIDYAAGEPTVTFRGDLG